MVKDLKHYGFTSQYFFELKEELFIFIYLHILFFSDFDDSSMRWDGDSILHPSFCSYCTLFVQDKKRWRRWYIPLH